MGSGRVQSLNGSPKIRSLQVLCVCEGVCACVCVGVCVCVYVRACVRACIRVN